MYIIRNYASKLSVKCLTCMIVFINDMLPRSLSPHCPANLGFSITSVALVVRSSTLRKQTTEPVGWCWDEVLEYLYTKQIKSSIQKFIIENL